jgi:hypothetical protein
MGQARLKRVRERLKRVCTLALLVCTRYEQIDEFIKSLFVPIEGALP